LGAWLRLPYYLAYSQVGKYEFPQLVETVETIATNWGADAILVDTKGAGNQYIQPRSGKAPCGIIGINPSRVEKSMRFDGTMVMWRTGLVCLPECADYIDELLNFPVRPP